MDTKANKSLDGPALQLARILLSAALLITVATGSQCQDVDSSHVAPSYMIPYTLDQPMFTAKLPKALDEISGLAALDSSSIAAIQDEDGIVFLLDAESGELESKHRFGGRGDYEAIEAVGETMFVLRSNGTILEIRNWRHEETANTVKHDTWLSARYDTEGLAIDQDSTGLLVACKEYPGKGLKGKRAVYRFSIASAELARNPAIIIDAKAAVKSIPEGRVSRSMRRLLDIRRFKPSGLAVHPVSGHLYVVSSVSRSLTVFDTDGDVIGITRLDKDVLPQPEGIAFLRNGDLFIASESGRGRAHLLRYRYTPS